MPNALNPSWLEDFQALAATGNFSRAAAQRHMTQPAFGRRIRALEAWLGTPLFERSGHPVALTEAGEWFRGASRQLLDRLQRLPEEAQAVAGASASALRIAVTHALSFGFVPGWLHEVEARVAIGPVELISDMAARCETLLQQGRVHFLLCHTHAQVPARLDPAGFDRLEVGEDRLVPVSAPDAHGRPRHVLPAPAAGDGPGAAGRVAARAAGAPVAATAAVPLLAYGQDSALGRALQALHGPALAAAPVVVTAQAATVLRSLALEGRGLAFLPASLVAADLRRRRLLPAGDAAWAITLRLSLFRRREPLPARAEAFWAAARDSVPARRARR